MILNHFGDFMILILNRLLSGDLWFRLIGLRKVCFSAGLHAEGSESKVCDVLPLVAYYPSGYKGGGTHPPTVFWISHFLRLE